MAIVSIALAKMGLSKDSIGIYESFLWIVTICSSFWLAGITNGLLALYPKSSEQEKGQLFFETFVVIVAISFIAGLLQLSLGGSILILCYLLLNNVTYLIDYQLYLSHRTRALLIYGIVCAICQVLVSLIPLYLSGDVPWLMLGLLSLAVLKCSYLFYLMLPLRRSSISQVGIKRIMLFTAPLMLSFLVASSADYIDGTVVRHYFSLSDFTIFRYGAKEFPLFNILATTFGASMIPLLASDRVGGLASLRRDSLRYMHLFFPLAALLIIFHRLLFTTIFSIQFAVSGQIFAVLLLLTIPRVLFPQTILTALGDSRAILTSAILEMLTNLIVSVALVSNFGLVGVAFGTVLAFGVEKLIMISLLYKRHGIAPATYIPIAPYLMYSLSLILTYIGSVLYFS
jgi:hypothetical protein